MMFSDEYLPSPEIEVGSIGWDDEDEYVFFGDDSNDGHTLVRVQLFRDRDITKELDPKRAQGKKILCHLSGGFFRAPKKDTRCYVLLPRDLSESPVGGIVIATVERSPTTQFAKDRAVLDFGDDVHVVIKGKSVSIQDPDNRFIGVGTPRGGGDPGLLFQAADGSGGIIQEGKLGWFVADGGQAKSIMQMTSSKIEFCQSTGGYLKLDGDFYTLGTNCTVQGGAVYLGRAPIAANMVLWGPTGIGGIASPSVFVSAV